MKDLRIKERIHLVNGLYRWEYSIEVSRDHLSLIFDFAEKHGRYLWDRMNVDLVLSVSDVENRLIFSTCISSSDHKNSCKKHINNLLAECIPPAWLKESAKNGIAFTTL